MDQGLEEDEAVAVEKELEGGCSGVEAAERRKKVRRGDGVHVFHRSRLVVENDLAEKTAAKIRDEVMRRRIYVGVIVSFRRV